MLQNNKVLEMIQETDCCVLKNVQWQCIYKMAIKLPMYDF